MGLNIIGGFFRRRTHQARKMPSATTFSNVFRHCKSASGAAPLGSPYLHWELENGPAKGARLGVLMSSLSSFICTFFKFNFRAQSLLVYRPSLLSKFQEYSEMIPDLPKAIEDSIGTERFRCASRLTSHPRDLLSTQASGLLDKCVQLEGELETSRQWTEAKSLHP